MPKFNPTKSPNTKMIQSIQEKGNMQANSRPTVDLDLSLIDENPDNAIVFNMDSIERLAETIKNEGFYGVVEVYRKEDGRYELSSGHRRTRAAKMLGWTKIPAIITEKPENDTSARKKLIFSNINNRDMTPMDWARALNYHKDTIRKEAGIDGISKQKSMAVNVVSVVSRDFSMSEPSVYRYLSLLQLIPELQELIEKKQIPWRAVAAISSESKELQYKVLDAINKMLLSGHNADGEIISLSAGQVDSIIYAERKAGVKSNSEPNSKPQSVSSPSTWDSTFADASLEDIGPPNEQEKQEPSEIKTSTGNFAKLTGIEEEPIVEVFPKPQVVTIDKDIQIFANTLDKLLDGEFVIENKSEIYKHIGIIEAGLEQIKKEL